MANISKYLVRLVGSKLGAMSRSALNENQMSEKQGQSATGGSTALQAAGDIIVTNNTGLTLVEARQVAIDVFNANFLRLADEAASIAGARAESLREKFFDRVTQENPGGLEQARDPGFQHAFYTAQKEQARTGDPDLGDLLVDLLVDRTKHSNRDILQIVLDESLATAPKLTDKQIAALSLIFLFRYTQDGGLVNDEALGAYFDKYVEPIASNVATSVASFQHLEFTGCGTVGAFQFIPEQNLAKSCQGLFVKGFDPQEIGSRGIPMEHVRGLFMPCVNDPTKLQVKALNQEVLEALLASLSISAEESLKVQELFDANKMSHEEIRAKCVKLRPYMDNVFDTWSDSSMKSFTLTSVGIAIGHANIKRIIGQEFADLSVWIN